MNKEEIKPPKKELPSTIHEYLKGCVKTSTGGFLNPLIDIVLPSFHQKRFEKWCENIYKALMDLEETKLSKIDLSKDEEFISILKECVAIASKTHQQEKHSLLKNVLIKHFDSNLVFDSKIIFTRLIDNLTISHIYLLKLIDKYSEEIKDLRVFTEIEEIFKLDIISKGIPHNSFRMLLNDLEKSNLIATGEIDFEVIVRQSFVLSTGEDNSLPNITITDFGKSFIDYVIHGNN